MPTSDPAAPSGPATPSSPAGFPDAPDPVTLPGESTLRPAKARSSHSRRVRVLAAVVAVPMALAIGGRIAGLGSGDSGGSSSPGTVATAPAYPGGTTATTPPGSGLGTASPPSATPTTPASTTPTTQALPGTDLVISVTPETGFTYGTETSERVTIAIVNQGDTASAPGTISLARGTTPLAVQGVVGEVDGADGSSTTSGFGVTGSGTITIPAVPAGGRVSATANYQFSGKATTVTATTTIKGAKILGTSTNSARELS